MCDLVDWVAIVSLVLLYGAVMAYYWVSHRRETEVDRERLKFYRAAQAWFRCGLDEEVSDENPGSV